MCIARDSIISAREFGKYRVMQADACVRDSIAGKQAKRKRLFCRRCRIVEKQVKVEVTIKDFQVGKPGSFSHPGTVLVRSVFLISFRFSLSELPFGYFLRLLNLGGFIIQLPFVFYDLLCNPLIHSFSFLLCNLIAFFPAFPSAFCSF